jgi:hypothetical protein
MVFFSFQNEFFYYLWIFDSKFSVVYYLFLIDINMNAQNLSCRFFYCEKFWFKIVLQIIIVINLFMMNTLINLYL